MVENLRRARITQRGSYSLGANGADLCQTPRWEPLGLGNVRGDGDGVGRVGEDGGCEEEWKWVGGGGYAGSEATTVE